jgi:hypothetical protein
MRLCIAAALLVLNGCATLPPTRDPEGCDRVSESAKRAGSDLVVDGNLYCATDEGDCDLTESRIVASKLPARSTPGKLPIHILRKEADDYSKQLASRNQIAFCYPAEMWFPSEGHYRGRFYLRREDGGRYHMAFYPRTMD